MAFGGYLVPSSQDGLTPTATMIGRADEALANIHTGHKFSDDQILEIDEFQNTSGEKREKPRAAT